ncbi:MAG TPA: hypothetical protein EYP10_05875 [Armatimonadetes bacterium]|nr:hypothetical protein [Armatimonadota bacterium]
MWRLIRWKKALKYLSVIALVVFVIGVIYLHYRRQIPLIHFLPVTDNAQLARNVMRGQGLRTSFLRPLAMALTKSDSSRALPSDIVNPPVTAIITGFCFAVIGEDDKAVIRIGIATYLTAIAICTALAYYAFGSIAGVLTTLLLTLNARLVDAAVNGFPGFIPACLIAWCAFKLLTLLRNPLPSPQLPRRTRFINHLRRLIITIAYLRTFFWYGLLAGMTALSWFPMLPAVPVLILYSGRASSRQWRVYAVLTGLFAASIVIGGWIWRNYRVTGKPILTIMSYEVMMWSDVYPGYSLYRATTPPVETPYGFIIHRPLTFLHKFIRETAEGIRTISNTLGPITIAFLILFALRPVSRGDADARWRYAMWLTAILIGIWVCAHHVTGFSFLPIAPLLTLFAASAMGACIDQLLNTRPAWLLRLSTQTATNLLSAILLCIHALPTLSLLLQPISHADATSYRRTWDGVARITSPTEAVITDIPWLVAWHCDRRAIWFPHHPAEVGWIRRRIKNANVIFLSSALRTYPAVEARSWWQLLARRETPAGYRVVARSNRGDIIMRWEDSNRQRTRPPTTR